VALASPAVHHRFVAVGGGYRDAMRFMLSAYLGVIVLGLVVYTVIGLSGR
jgi:hypothetical protein